MTLQFRNLHLFFWPYARTVQDEGISAPVCDDLCIYTAVYDSIMELNFLAKSVRSCSL